MTNEEIIKQIESMTVVELNELVKAIEEKFGVSPIPSAFGGATGQAAASEETGVAEEKDSFNVILTDAGQSKIQVIKVIREITGKGLKEAKDLTDKTPAVVKEGVKKEEAENLKKKIEEAGGSVELK